MASSLLAPVDVPRCTIFEAALARAADLAVDLMTQHLETTAIHLEAVAPSTDRRPRRWLAGVAMSGIGHLR